eukprot:TRINITY_DN15622_c0_g1_i1.p1 TRINITY_DN15622_c0_g1~~TRINITY_DN15622_c0_g1_i1.p1  ORF type:complete len:328 (+),score=16.64 TRINITY_DN15622_c0_g1_i1:190-1173(+)
MCIRDRYTQISDAIKKATTQTGRPMVLSVCEWGSNSPWNWAPAISTMWRTSQDIIYYGDQADMKRVLTNFDSAQHASAQTPGHYNDPDMLIVGMKSFTLAQNRTHMALWAIASAPLLAGNDIATMSADTKSVLTNKEVIAIDQDPLGKQGTKVSDSNGLQVYSKVLSGTGKRAVLLLNRGTAAGTITVKFADIGLGTTATVRDLWAGTDLGSKTASYAASVPSMDSVFLLITDAPTPQGLGSRGSRHRAARDVDVAVIDAGKKRGSVRRDACALPIMHSLPRGPGHARVGRRVDVIIEGHGNQHVSICRGRNVVPPSRVRPLNPGRP